MYQPKYYTLTFMVRKAQTKKSGEVPIFARITISGQRTEFSLNRSVKPKDWNPAKEASDGRSKTDIELNKYWRFFPANAIEFPGPACSSLRANKL